MKRLTKELKLKIYNEYMSSGISMPELSRKYNISVSTIYKLRKEIEKEKEADKNNTIEENKEEK